MRARPARLAAAALAAALFAPAARAAAQAAPALTPVAVFRFSAPRGADLPAEVTVADSAGTLVGRYRLAGARAVRPLAVEVLGDDLILQDETPAGLLTLRLAGQNDPAAAPAGAALGEWFLGARHGVLARRVVVAAR